MQGCAGPRFWVNRAVLLGFAGFAPDLGVNKKPRRFDPAGFLLF